LQIADQITEQLGSIQYLLYTFMTHYIITYTRHRMCRIHIA